jgi:diguanylate cyclase (GGDEF)-like protein
MIDNLANPASDPVRMLLVEDDERDFARIRAMLAEIRHACFAIDWARDLQGALERLRGGRFDICLVDHDLPDGDGLQFVRAAESRGGSAPSIMLSGDGSLELDMEAMALGAADFLEKDHLDARRLERSIRYALSRRRQALRLAHIAQHDELTGLANRSLFQDRLQRALAFARRHGRMAAVMVLDLNGFKAINDRLGHTAGDRLLCIVARRIVSRLRETDTVARLGGDEFALIIENLAKAEHAALVARKVLDAVAPPVSLDGEEVRVTGSLGVAIHPAGGLDGEALLRAADAAMYRAKAEGGNLCRFSSDQLERRVQRGAIVESDLRRALAGGELVLHFQPQVTLASDALGISGLVRWNHPELGLIGAERFLSLAEDSGLLEPLSNWVLESGCAQIARWRAQGIGRLHLALPLLSRQQLAWTDLGARVARHLEAVGIAADRLEIELGEELLLAELERGGGALAALREQGLRLALDGFGRGPTSLKSLGAGVLDTVKLARELLDGVPERPEPTATLAAILELTGALGLRLVAEGVDHQRQLGFLRARGCSAVQAFMSCPPLPAESCTGWLRQAASRRERADAPLPPPEAPPHERPPLALRAGE